MPTPIPMMFGFLKNKKNKALEADAQVAAPTASDTALVVAAESAAADLSVLNLIEDLPPTLAAKAREVLALHSEVNNKKESLEDEAQYILKQIHRTYLPDILEQFIDADAKGSANKLIDGTYTAAQICEQNLMMLIDKLNQLSSDQTSQVGQDIVLQRNFLLQRLNVTNVPEPTDSAVFELEIKAKPVLMIEPPQPAVAAEKVASKTDDYYINGFLHKTQASVRLEGATKRHDRTVHIPRVGEKIVLDIVSMVNDWRLGINGFERDWNWEVSRDYGRNRTLLGTVTKISMETLSNGGTSYLCDVDVKRHGPVTGIDSYYISAKPDPDAEKVSTQLDEIDNKLNILEALNNINGLIKDMPSTDHGQVEIHHLASSHSANREIVALEKHSKWLLETINQTDVQMRSATKSGNNRLAREWFDALTSLKKELTEANCEIARLADESKSSIKIAGTAKDVMRSTATHEMQLETIQRALGMNDNKKAAQYLADSKKKLAKLDKKKPTPVASATPADAHPLFKQGRYNDVTLESYLQQYSKVAKTGSQKTKFTKKTANPFAGLK